MAKTSEQELAELKVFIRKVRRWAASMTVTNVDTTNLAKDFFDEADQLLRKYDK